MTDSVPIFVNCWNRVTYARVIVDQLLALPESLPFIVDNASTWPPMRQWLREQHIAGDPRTIILDLWDNIGNYAVWTKIPDKDSTIINRYKDHFKYYVVTDDDMDLSTVPHDVLDVLRDLLDTNPDVIKVGLALRIDDLPQSYPLADHVRRFESAYWTKPLGVHCHEARGIPVYDAPIDTTFAMYRMADLSKIMADGVAGRGMRALRVAGAYTVRHRPWYLSVDDIANDDEQMYYLANSNTFTQWTVNLQHYFNARQLWPWQQTPKGEATQQEEQGR